MPLVLHRRDFPKTCGQRRVRSHSCRTTETLPSRQQLLSTRGVRSVARWAESPEKGGDFVSAKALGHVGVRRELPDSPVAILVLVSLMNWYIYTCPRMLHRRMRGSTQLAQPCSLLGHALVFMRRRDLDNMQPSRTCSGTLVFDSCMGGVGSCFRVLPSTCSALGLMSNPLVLA